MDERLERDLRVGLAALLDPVAESHPRWETSPAAGRVVGVPASRGPSVRLTAPWAAALAALLLVGLMAAALFVGGWRPDRAVVIAPSPTPAATAATADDEGTDVLATTKARPLPAQATCPPGSDPDALGPADQERPSGPDHGLRVEVGLDAGAAEAVDRLLRVADHEEAAFGYDDVLPQLLTSITPAGDPDGELDLDRVGVLELVEQEPLVAIVERGAGVLGPSEQVSGKHEKVVELQLPAAPAFPRLGQHTTTGPVRKVAQALPDDLVAQGDDLLLDGPDLVADGLRILAGPVGLAADIPHLECRDCRDRLQHVPHRRGGLDRLQDGPELARSWRRACRRGSCTSPASRRPGSVRLGPAPGRGS